MRIAEFGIRRAGVVPFRGVVPERGPGGAAVGAAKNLVVRMPVAERRGHERGRMLRVHGHGAVTKWLAIVG